MAQASSHSDVPDLGRRQFMNLLTFGTITGMVLGAAYPFVAYFVPPSSGAAGGGATAKDAQGNDVKVSAFVAGKAAGDRALAQGLKGDPTYIIVADGGSVVNYGINAICTHLGCVVPWNVAENKFMCPCHGSQYDTTGKVVRGPAPKSLPLAHAAVTENDTVALTPWTETDFRTDEPAWWA
jgi:cytochrome b6-f complex iron-sulfur subunit